MAHRTPLRLIEAEEGAPAREDQEGAPVETFDDNDAATRKVAVSGMIASEVVFRSRWKRRSTWQMLVPVAGVVVLGVLTVLLAARDWTTAVSPAAPGGVAMVPSPRHDGSPQPQAPQPVLAPAAADAAKAATVPEMIHVRVRATPMEAELSLDGKVVAGHRLNLDVPKDGLAHFVSAWASGYVPFTRQVTFSGDVDLDITLRRDPASSSHSATRPRPSPVVPAARRVVPAVKPTATPTVTPAVKPTVTPAVKPTVMPAPVQAPVPQRMNVEPGMNLDRPSVRSDAKSIDERNPYRP